MPWGCLVVLSLGSISRAAGSWGTWSCPIGLLIKYKRSSAMRNPYQCGSYALVFGYCRRLTKPDRILERPPRGCLSILLQDQESTAPWDQRVADHVAAHESGIGPSRQILRWNLMSASGVLGTGWTIPGLPHEPSGTITPGVHLLRLAEPHGTSVLWPEVSGAGRDRLVSPSRAAPQ